MINRFNQLIATLSLLIFLATTSYAAESLVAVEQKPENPERWFQIEVIVFQHSDLSDLKAEQWPEHIKNRNYQDVIDFLSPIPSAVEESDLANSKSIDSALIELEPALLAPETELPVADPPLLKFDLLKSELPFLPLQQQYFTMADKLTSIKRSGKYRLLRHMTWRQPVYDAKQAVSVRILGGDDFAKNFNPDGTKIQQASLFTGSLDDALESQDDIDINQLTPDDLINAQILEAQPLAAEDYFTEIKTEESLAIEEDPPVNEIQQLNSPLPHLWELDGFIKIHLKRYLHINLDLEIKQLQEKLISAEQFDKFTDSQEFLQNNNEPAKFEINWETTNTE